jgi:anti-anti-sigma factor
MTWELRIAREWAGNVLIVVTSGRIGHADAPRLGTVLREAARDARAVVVDLSGVDYLSGSAATVLSGAAGRDGGDGSMVVCGLRDSVRIALALAGVLDALPVAATRAESIARFQERK